MRLPGGHPHHVLKGAHRQALLNRVHDLGAAPLDVGGEVGYEVLLGQPGESLLIDDQMGQRWRRRAWRRRATSAASEVSGNCGAVTVNPDACNVRITSLQLEPSAQAPWTSTTFGLSLMVKILRAEPAASHESTDSFLNRPPGPQTRLAIGRAR